MSKRVIVESAKNQLVGVLSGNNNDSLVILCHGYTGSKEANGIKHIANSLQSSGVSTFRFDFSGSGESGGSKQMSIKKQANDLKAVIEYFSNYRKIYLLGHSLGVLPVVMNAANLKVAGIITINGYFQGKIYRPDYQLMFCSLQLLRLFSPRVRSEWSYLKKHFQPETVNKPALLVTTKNDLVIDHRQSFVFGEKLKSPHQTLTLSLSGHGIEEERDGKLIGATIIKWMKTL